MFYSRVEEIVGEQIPTCIKTILTSCGFNSLLSLRNISVESLVLIESHMNTHGQNFIQLFDCCHAEIYKTQREFKLIPGHRNVILSISEHVALYLKNRTSETQCESLLQALSDMSLILKELVRTAVQNQNQPKNKAQYSDCIRYFATYVFTLCGRSCYEVLYRNLPLPSISTVCKY